MMRPLLATIGTAIAGLVISFLLPSGQHLSQFMTAPIGAPSPPRIQEQGLAGTTDGFGTLLPSPAATEESNRYREYQQKVQQLLTQLEAVTDNRSSYRTLAFNDDSLIHSGNSPQPRSVELRVETPLNLRGRDQIPALALKDGQNTTLPITNNQQPITNLGELQENPNDRIQRIVLVGDSMIETLGKDLPYLRTILESSYPNKTFALYNYGHGATNLDQGCTRLTQETTYLNTNYPPILSMKPQIIVLESFAYNHWSSASYDLDRHWITLAKCIDTIKKESPKTHIILAATIGPNPQSNGSALPNWSRENQLEWNKTTHAYLKNLLRLAASEKYPVADAYTPSLDSSGNGLTQYINATDHLHPSEAGKRLFAEKIAETIQHYSLIQ